MEWLFHHSQSEGLGVIIGKSRVKRPLQPTTSSSPADSSSKGEWKDVDGKGLMAGRTKAVGKRKVEKRDLTNDSKRTFDDMNAGTKQGGNDGRITSGATKNDKTRKNEKDGRNSSTDGQNPRGGVSKATVPSGVPLSLIDHSFLDTPPSPPLPTSSTIASSSTLPVRNGFSQYPKASPHRKNELNAREQVRARLNGELGSPERARQPPRSGPQSSKPNIKSKSTTSVSGSTSMARKPRKPAAFPFEPPNEGLLRHSSQLSSSQDSDHISRVQEMKKKRVGLDDMSSRRDEENRDTRGIKTAAGDIGRLNKDIWAGMTDSPDPLELSASPFNHFASPTPSPRHRSKLQDQNRKDRSHGQSKATKSKHVDRKPQSLRHSPSKDSFGVNDETPVPSSSNPKPKPPDARKVSNTSIQGAVKKRRVTLSTDEKDEDVDKTPKPRHTKSNVGVKKSILDEDNNHRLGQKKNRKSSKREDEDEEADDGAAFFKRLATMGEDEKRRILGPPTSQIRVDDASSVLVPSSPIPILSSLEEPPDDEDYLGPADKAFCETFINHTDLCEYCSLPMPLRPSLQLTTLRAKLVTAKESMSDGRALPWQRTIEFCSLHEAETTIIPLGIRIGYPRDIDFSILEERLEERWIREELEEIMNNPERSTFFTKTIKDIRKKGKLQWGGVNHQCETRVMDMSMPGYYGHLGRSIMLRHFRNLLQWDLLTTLSPGVDNDAPCHPLTPLEFISHVLVPECAIRLIMFDRGWNGELDETTDEWATARTGAYKVWKTSVEYGKWRFREDGREARRVLDGIEAKTEGTKEACVRRRKGSTSRLRKSKEVIEVLDSSPVLTVTPSLATRRRQTPSETSEPSTPTSIDIDITPLANRRAGDDDPSPTLTTDNRGGGMNEARTTKSSTKSSSFSSYGDPWDDSALLKVTEEAETAYDSNSRSIAAR